MRILFRQGKSDEEIAGIMGRGKTGVERKRQEMGLHKPDAIALGRKKWHKYTADELEFIKNWWDKKSDKWMARKLGVGVDAYRAVRRRMSEKSLSGKKRETPLKKTWTQQKGMRKTWTYAQEEFLREHYPTKDTAEIARILGRKPAAIIDKAKRIGIKKAYKPGARGYEPIDGYYKKGCAPGGER